MHSGELLERSPQLESLHAYLRSARSGVGGFVFVGGEAGIGKTALVRRFCSEIVPGARVLVGGCDTMTTPRPLAPLFDMAPELGEDFAASLASDAPGHIFDLLVRELRTGRVPTLVVLEDVHWADDATLDLLRFLGRRVGSTRSLIIATYRDDEAGPLHPLRTVIGDLATSTLVERLTVPPLSRMAVARLARNAGVETAVESGELYRTTGGNPFFVTELLAAQGLGLPATIQDAVLARAGRLPEAGRKALDLASIIGAQVDPALLTALGAEIQAIEACVAAGMLQDSGQLLSFRHDLVRYAINRAIAAPRRRVLHGLVFAALQATSARRGDLATLAHHAAESGDARAILQVVPTAARRAARLGAHNEARAQHFRALPYLDQLTEVEHVQLLEAYATECSICDHLQESARMRREVVDRWQSLGRLDRVGVNLSILAQAFVGAGTQCRRQHDERRSHRRARAARCGSGAGAGILVPGQYQHAGLQPERGRRVGRARNHPRALGR